MRGLGGSGGAGVCLFWAGLGPSISQYFKVSLAASPYLRKIDSHSLGKKFYLSKYKANNYETS